MSALPNLLPALSDEERAALKASMAEHGWWPEFPAIQDEEGNTLDGWHRIDLANELGIKPVIKVKRGLSAIDKLAFAIKANTHRRSLSPAARRNILKRYMEVHEADLKAAAKAARSEGGKRGAEATWGSVNDTTLEEPTKDARSRSAAASSAETRFDEPVVAVPSKRGEADTLAKFGTLLGVSRSTAARDKAIVDREERIEAAAKAAGRDDVIRQLDGTRPNYDELERAVGLRDPLPEPVEDTSDRAGWVLALAKALDHLAPAVSVEEAGVLLATVKDPVLLVQQLGTLRGRVAEAKKGSKP